MVVVTVASGAVGLAEVQAVLCWASLRWPAHRPGWQCRRVPGFTARGRWGLDDAREPRVAVSAMCCPRTPDGCASPCIAQRDSDRVAVLSGCTVVKRRSASVTATIVQLSLMPHGQSSALPTRNGQEFHKLPLHWKLQNVLPMPSVGSLIEDKAALQERFSTRTKHW